MGRAFSTTEAQQKLTVTNASQELIAALTNELGRDITIQNNHATANVYMNFSGEAIASDTEGMFRVRPGAILNFPDVSNAVAFIGDVASNEAVTASVGTWRNAKK